MLHPPTLSASLLLVLATGSLGTDAVGQRPRSSWRDRAAAKHGTLQNLVYKPDQEFATKTMRRGVYSIYLPKGYDDAKNQATHYPVVYFLHGLNEDHNRFHSRGGATVLDEMVGSGAVPKLIFVCAFDGSRRSFYVNAGASKVEDMIATDLVAHVDETYRTAATRASRALLGVSMGGFGALKIAFRNPTVFGAVATHSAAILPAKSAELDGMFPWASRSRLAASVFGDPVDEKRWADENPLCLARTLDVATLRTLRIHFDCGDRDRYGLQTTNGQMHEILTRRKVPHSWTLVKGGSHGWNTRETEVGYNIANLPNSLRFLAAAFRQKAAIRGLSGALDRKGAGDGTGSGDGKGSGAGTGGGGKGGDGKGNTGSGKAHPGK